MTINEISKKTGKSANSISIKIHQLGFQKYASPNGRYDFSEEIADKLIESLMTDKRFSKRLKPLTQKDINRIYTELRKGTQEKIIANRLKCHITTVFAYKRKLRAAGESLPRGRQN